MTTTAKTRVTLTPAGQSTLASTHRESATSRRFCEALDRGDHATAASVLRRCPSLRGRVQTYYAGGGQLSIGCGGWTLATLPLPDSAPHQGAHNGRGWALYVAKILSAE